MAIWSITPAEPIILYENQTNVNIYVQVLPEQNDPQFNLVNVHPPVGTAWPFIWQQYDQYRGVLHAPTLDGIIPINHIKYRENDNLLTVYRWDDVPANSQIYDYSKQSGPITIPVVAEAMIWGSGQLITHNFDITIRGDFSSGISKLLSKVNTSSEFRK